MACQQKIIKINSNILFTFLQANLNNTIETSTFLEQLKYADVKPVFQKDSRTDKKNYRPMSIPNASKIYERCLNKQLEDQTLQKAIFRHYYVNIKVIFGNVIA